MTSKRRKHHENHGMLHMFIDANIYLSFYRLTNDDLDQLEKLATLLREEHVCLYLTGQVRDEYLRNREGVIAESLKSIKLMKLPNEFPRFCEGYDEYEQLRGITKEFETSRSELLRKVESDIYDKNLKADQIIQQLFTEGDYLEVTTDVINLAQSRMLRGNPPGKQGRSGTYGDAINWELLLRYVPEEEDLHLIAGDSDFYSDLHASKPKEFLEDEWNRTKRSNLYLYTGLAKFFKKHYPDIKMAVDLEKELAIQKLVSSASYSDTHAAIRELSRHRAFTQRQVSILAMAALQNKQVHHILQDFDVRKFFRALLTEHGTHLLDEVYNELCIHLDLSPRGFSNEGYDDDLDDLPF